jgi:hypothetical protein
MKTKNKNLIVALALGGLFGGCATANIPAQLSEAQQTYVALSSGRTTKLTAADLSDAKQALEKANRELAEHGDTNVCRDYAYIAQNKLELADAVAQTEMDRRTVVEALKAGARTATSQDHGPSMSVASAGSN